MAELISADVWHDDIRAEDIRDKGVQGDYCLQAIFRETDVTTFGLKVMGEEFGDDWIIFCDQDLMHEVTAAAFSREILFRKGVFPSSAAFFSLDQAFFVSNQMVNFLLNEECCFFAHVMRGAFPKGQ